MKKRCILLLLLLAGILCPLPDAKAQDPVAAAIKEGVTKVIKALDLRIQRQQNEVIWLQNAQKALENAMEEHRLREIHEWVERQRDLYQGYYQELHQVKHAVADFQRIRGIAQRQALLLREYERAWHLLRKDEYFSLEEREYMARVYGGILERSLRHMDQLLVVVRPHALQAGDFERIRLIGVLADQVETAYQELVLFNRQNFQLRQQRARTEQEINTVRKLYGLP